MISFFLQGSPIPAITVTDEHANTLTVTEEQTTQEMERENTENQAQITAQEPEVVKQFFLFNHRSEIIYSTCTPVCRSHMNELNPS